MAKKRDALGNTKLFPVSEFRGLSDMDNELKILEDPQFNEANKLMADRWKPKHNIAFVSLCSSTRPYHHSPKWKKFIDLFGKDCDMIVSSNGGVIPQEWWNSYPFLTYDAGEHLDDDLYKRILYDRWKYFFDNNSYEYIIMNFKEHQRNYEPAQQLCKELLLEKKIKGYTFIPDAETYIQILEKPHQKLFPDINPIALEVMNKYIKSVSNSKPLKSKNGVL